GGDGNDFVNGGLGSDGIRLGAGNDVVQWNPGDGNDTVDGQEGADTMVFNGSSANERMAGSASNGRARFTRDIGAVTIDVDGVETLDPRPLGGSDTLTVNDLTGTDVTGVNWDLAGSNGFDDAAADSVTVNATNGDDVVVVAASGTNAAVFGLAA